MLELQPYGEPITFEVGEPLVFRDFSLTYLGEESSQGHSGKSTALFTRRNFRIQEKSGQDQTLSVLCGQLPPQPVLFHMGQKAFTLLTYQMPYGERLYPHRLAVIGPGNS